jgi:Domain of unknown function (DUF6484)
MSAAEIEQLLATTLGGTERETWPVPPRKINGVVIGELVGLADEGRTPLVVYPGQPGSAALPAQTAADLQGAHIGRRIVLMFETGEPLKPIVMGYLRQDEGWPLAEPPGQVEVDVDGERLIVSAKEQVVIKCGKASITLTKAGKVLIQGTYVLSKSAGVNRIKGGSVQLN